MPDSELAREIKVLSRDKKDLVHDKVRITNQIASTLKSYFPVALELFDELDSSVAINFLTKYPTYEDALKLSKEKIRKFLQTHRIRNLTERTNEIYELLHTPQIKVPQFMIRTKKRLMLALLTQLRPLLDQIKRYEKEISHLLKQHPDSKIYLSLPGMGDTLAARVLGEIGDNRDRYKNSNSIQCHAGTAPITKFSGKSKRIVKARKSCNKQLKDAMQLFAFCSLLKSLWAREFYDEHRAKGNTHNQALRALANRWLEIIYTILQKSQLYNEEYHQSLRAKYLSKKLEQINL
jgi:plasmid maintenance system antidote protein VapI